MMYYKIVLYQSLLSYTTTATSVLLPFLPVYGGKQVSSNVATLLLHFFLFVYPSCSLQNLANSTSNHHTTRGSPTQILFKFCTLVTHHKYIQNLNFFDSGSSRSKDMGQSILTQSHRPEMVKWS